MNFVNAACVVLAVASCAAGCATPASAADQVRDTTTLADVAGCTLLGKVVVSESPDAAKEAHHQTASLGGNVLLRKTESVWNGNAYKCPAVQ